MHLFMRCAVVPWDPNPAFEAWDANGKGAASGSSRRRRLGYDQKSRNQAANTKKASGTDPTRLQEHSWPPRQCCSCSSCCCCRLYPRDTTADVRSLTPGVLAGFCSGALVFPRNRNGRGGKERGTWALRWPQHSGKDRATYLYHEYCSEAAGRRGVCIPRRRLVTSAYPRCGVLLSLLAGRYYVRF